MPRISTLRRFATLESFTGAADGLGGFLPGWTAIGDHWVQLAPVSGEELHQGARDVPRITHRITLRCPRGARPRPDQRFRIGDRRFGIRAVFDRDGRGRFLTCLVEEGGDTA